MTRVNENNRINTFSRFDQVRKTTEIYYFDEYFDYLKRKIKFCT